jgi:pilus assembly protein CpaC
MKRIQGLRGAGWRCGVWAILASVTLAFLPQEGAAQEEIGAVRVVTVPRGNSVVVTHPSTMERVLITDPDVADAVPVSGTEVVLNGTRPGSTTLLVWGLDGSRALYTVRVVANTLYLEEELARLLPGSGIRALSAGSSVVLTGTGVDPRVAERAVTLARSLAGTGVDIVDHISVPERAQVLLRVRLGEVNRSAVQNLGTRFLWSDPNGGEGGSQGGIGTSGFRGDFPGDGPTVTFSDAVNFYFFHQPSNVAAFLRALREEGAFQSLAEPNLLAFPGEEASFLAGGEFPFPVVQGQTGTVSVDFREFGVRLRFQPEITNSGGIRLRVAPEVSQLDFGAGLNLQGFTVPVLLTRRVETVVELQEGQTFAIAGLMDSQSVRGNSKIPFLGEIPIIGGLFQSRETRDAQTELLVLVTPQLVYPQDQAPPLPTGEVEEWGWDRYLRRFNPYPESPGQVQPEEGEGESEPEPEPVGASPVAREPEL